MITETSFPFVSFFAFRDAWDMSSVLLKEMVYVERSACIRYLWSRYLVTEEFGNEPGGARKSQHGGR